MGNRTRSVPGPRSRSIFHRQPPVRAIFISTRRSRATWRLAGTTLPLGGSTGSLIQLANGMTLTVTINYQGQTSPDVATVVVSNLVSATDPMPAVATPGNVVGTFQVTDDGQDGTGQTLRTRFRPSGRDRSERRRL